jgi:hypothetical protein
MVRKEVEGGNRQRRQLAREAHEHGKLPSEMGLTTGASKQRFRLRRGKEHQERIRAIRRGKQTTSRANKPEAKPRSRPEGPPKEWP